MPTLLAAYAGTNFEGEYKLGSHSYILPTGGVIYCCSLEDPDHIEGGQYNAWWLDEAGQMKARAWTVIQARLGFNRGRCLFTTTPYALNWFYTEIYKRAKEGDPDYFVSQFSSITNPAYPKEEFERAKRSMDETTFALRYLGEFRRMQGLVWPDFSQWVCQIEDINKALEKRNLYPKQHREVGGIDFGYNNPFVALQAFIDPDGIMWVYAEHYAERTLLKDHAAKLQSGCEYWADPSGLQERQELQSHGIITNPADNDVQMGIERVTKRGKTGQLRISPDCRNLISEAETYHYKEEKDEPVKEHDHCLDALRYLVMGLDGKPAPAIISFAEPEHKYQSEEEAMFAEDGIVWQEVA